MYFSKVNMLHMGYNKILMIEHESTGCSNNVYALSLALSLHLPGAKIDIISGKIYTKILTFILRALMFVLPAHYRLWQYLWPFLFKGTVPPSSNYRFVLSTLGSGEAIGAAAAYLCGAKLIHIGTPRRMPNKYFDMIIANPGVDPKKGEFNFPVPPSRIALLNIQEEGWKLKETLVNSSENYKVLLLGGPAADVNFTREYWDKIFKLIEDEAKSNVCKWLVATSPRTPAGVIEKVEKIAQQNDGPIAHLNIFRKGQQSYLPAYLGAASSIFVTAESISMIADALTTNKNVIILNMTCAIKNSRINGFLRLVDIKDGVQVLYLDMPNKVIKYRNRVSRTNWVGCFFEALLKRGLLD